MDAPRTDRALVLIIDDDARTAQRLARMLREDGFAVEVAVDGAGAISRLSREPAPQVVVTDLRMPHADGASVIRYARSRDPGVVAIVVTSYPYMGHTLVDLSPPVVVLPKPIAYDELVGELDRALIGV